MNRRTACRLMLAMLGVPFTAAAVSYAAAPAAAADPFGAGDYFVFTGTHNAGATRGFYLARFDSKTGALSTPALAAHSDGNAYFIVAPDYKHIYTCNSVNNFGGAPHMGAIGAWSLDAHTGAVALLNQKPSGGEDPSYLSLDHTNKFLLVANYQGNRVAGEGGTIAAFALLPDGSLGERTAFIQHKGSSIDPARQKQAYAHSVILDPTNRFAIVCDLGLDKVFTYRFDQTQGTLTPNDPPAVAVKPGSGPRHPVFSPDGKTLYVIHEMGSMITAFHWDSAAGTLASFQEISTRPPEATGTNACAEIRISPDGRFVYASNRGDDTIATFSIDPQSAHLTLIDTLKSGGKTPRNFDWDPSAAWMIVTNHDSDNAVVFHRDPATGKLTQQGNPIAVTYPFCPRFVPIQNPRR